jgi:hypothetical protein
MIDTSRLGQLTAKLMENIAERFENVENAAIGDVAVVVEVDTPAASVFWWDCTDDRYWVTAALFSEAIDSIDAIREQMGRAELESDEEL